MGGASVANVAFSVVRGKAVAVLLGPQGVGLLGLYSSIADFAQALGALGIPEAGVRQIAEAAGEGEVDRIARTAALLRWASLALAGLGATLLAALSLPVAHLTFGDGQHAAGVTLLSVAVFFRLLAGGQGALLQGMRRIGDLAKISILGGLFSTLVTIPMIYVLGEEGIVPSLVVTAAFVFLVSWWYARRIGAGPLVAPRTAICAEGAVLLRLGLAFMTTTLLAVGSAYAIRIIVVAHEGAAGAGFYQAAWALGGIYAGFILQAMGTDFYPRLTAAAGDDTACNRLVNEQAHVGLLLAGPGVIVTLVLAPMVVRIFYTSEFYPAADLLRWICLGMMLRVVAWPMGFIVIAKGARMIFICTELAATVVHIGLALLLVGEFGSVGAGAAFLGLYVWHTAVIYIVVRQMSGFRWSSDNVRLMLAFLPACCVVFAGFFLLPAWQASVLGAVVAVCGGVYSLLALLTLVPADSLPHAVRRWLPAADPGA